jgi:hypothetical protein
MVVRNEKRRQGSSIRQVKPLSSFDEPQQQNKKQHKKTIEPLQTAQQTMSQWVSTQASSDKQSKQSPRNEAHAFKLTVNVQLSHERRI